MNNYKTTSSLERYIQGTGEVLNNLARELEGIKDRISKRGMWTVVLKLKAKAIPLTPVGPSKATAKARGKHYIGTGNLVNSYSTFVYETQNGIEGFLVNNAAYALFVHEMPEWYNYTKTGTGPKFVEKPLKEGQAEFLEILRNTARIPP